MRERENVAGLRGVTFLGKVRHRVGVLVTDDGRSHRLSLCRVRLHAVRDETALAHLPECKRCETEAVE